MPKVTDEYLAGKKQFILECTAEILKEKPLYHITMKDIIKQAGFSQGVVYRYYANIDEIFIDYINQNTMDTPLDATVDELLISGRPERVIVTECITAIGDYVETLLQSVGGKTCFDLIITYAHDSEKRNSVLPQLRFKQKLDYAQAKIAEFVVQSVRDGVFTPDTPIETIMMFAGVCVDGIVQSVATYGDARVDGRPVLDIPGLFRTLARTIIGLLEDGLCG